MRLSVDDHVEQGAWLLLPINQHTSLEEPVPAVFRVALGEVETLDTRGVTLQLGTEQPRVEVKVPLIKRQAWTTKGAI